MNEGQDGPLTTFPRGREKNIPKQCRFTGDFLRGPCEPKTRAIVLSSLASSVVIASTRDCATLNRADSEAVVTQPIAQLPKNPRNFAIVRES